MQETQHESGFDMKNTIAWYGTHEDRILAMLPPPEEAPFDVSCEHTEHLQIGPQELAALTGLLPISLRKALRIKKVVGRPKTWFHRDATGENPILTEDPGEALTPTAIVPAFYESHEEEGAGSIWLYEIGAEACTPEIARIILSEGYVHEMAHNLFNRLFSEKTMLLFKSGGITRITKGRDYLMEFSRLAEFRKPISHYASSYRDAAGKFLKDSKWGWQVPVSEEFAETLTAYLLGFAYCGDDRRGLWPMEDRTEIREWILDLTQAEIVFKTTA